MSLAESIARHAELAADRRAIVIADSAAGEPASLTYGELRTRVQRVAAALAARGARHERALLVLPTGLDFVVAFLGTISAGSVAVPMSPPTSTRDPLAARLALIAADARARFVLTNRRVAERWNDFVAIAPALASREVLIVEELADEPSSTASVPPPSDALAFLQYTSGSTSAPRGVMITHGNIVANLSAITAAIGFDRDDVMVSWLPLYHDMGLVSGLLLPLFRGACGVLMPTLRFLERPTRWLEALARYGGTVSGAPNFAFRMCAERIRDDVVAELDLRSWRIAFCGSEPIQPAVLRAFADKLAPAKFDSRALYPCYGLAESTLFVSGGQPEVGLRTSVADEASGGDERELVSCGACGPDHRILIVDPETAAPLRDDGVGEICVSGPSVAQGYWDNPRASEQTFTLIGERRWLRTGDLGFQSRGELFIVGRTKDVILIRGRNVYPPELEAAIAERLSSVSGDRVAAFAVRTLHGEGIGVAAELRAKDLKSTDLEDLCQQVSSAVFAVSGEPASVVALVPRGALPRTSSGKLKRRACTEALAAGTLGAACVRWREDLNV